VFFDRNGFDNDLYIRKQTEQIERRIGQFDNKLYLEFGGKLFDDFHAARVLPGFDVNGKVRLLKEFKDQAEIIFCIGAADIEKNKIRADLGITYDLDVLRLIDNMREIGLTISSIVITMFHEQPAAVAFKKKLEMRGERVYVHRPIPGYPTDVNSITSDEGFGSNPYIETTRPLVAVTAPGPGSGKLATCLSQIYHEAKRGIRSGYAKFETFPIWNLPLKHPVNLAYEAATADLKDVNMIDPFHLEAYGVTTVNYNRDVEVFPIVRTILDKCTGMGDLYRSPTDMGVNMAGYGIIDDEIVKKAACAEIIRRHYAAACDYKKGRADLDMVRRIEVIMKQLDIKDEDRPVVTPALEKAARAGAPAMAVELPDGRIVVGRESGLLNAPSSTLLNAVKTIAGLADELHLISPLVLEPILRMKHEVLGSRRPILKLDEVLIALSICAATNPMAELALSKVQELRGCEAHLSVFASRSDGTVFRKLGLNVTCEPEFPSKGLYYV